MHSKRLSSGDQEEETKESQKRKKVIDKSPFNSRNIHGKNEDQNLASIGKLARSIPSG